MSHPHGGGILTKCEPPPWGWDATQRGPYQLLLNHVVGVTITLPVSGKKVTGKKNTEKKSQFLLGKKNTEKKSQMKNFIGKKVTEIKSQKKSHKNVLRNIYFSCLEL